MFRFRAKARAAKIMGLLSIPEGAGIVKLSHKLRAFTKNKAARSPGGAVPLTPGGRPAIGFPEIFSSMATGQTLPIETYPHKKYTYRRRCRLISMTALFCSQHNIDGVSLNAYAKAHDASRTWRDPPLHGYWLWGFTPFSRVVSACQNLACSLAARLKSCPLARTSRSLAAPDG
jgi:hypothetical protein